MAMILSYKDKYPKIAEGVYIADNAVIIGDVEIKEGASVWFGAVIRADNDKIIIGKNTNIQDNCTLWLAGNRFSGSASGDSVINWVNGLDY